MKISGDPLAYAAKPPSGLRAALVYGPDRALVAETIATLRKSVLGDTADDFSFVILHPEDLKSTPTRLADELASMGFFADKKVILVKDAGDAVGRTAQEALTLPDAGHFLILEAENLTPKSTLRAWAEKGENVASLACYALEGQALNRFIQAQFQKRNASIASDAVAVIADRLGGDMSALGNIVQQLIDYVGGAKPVITTAHVEAMLVDQAEQDLEAVVQSFADGDFAQLDRALHSLAESGNSMVGVTRALQNYFYKLRTVHVAMKNGDGQEDALKRLRPPLFFKAKPGFIRHLRNWNLPRVDRALSEFLYLESLCKKTGTPELAVVQQRLFGLHGDRRRA